jgi:membrane protein YqaA with SNARE-associated domain
MNADEVVTIAPLIYVAIVFAMSLATALIPLGPPEAYILLYCAAGHAAPQWALAVAVAAAAGQMVGKLVVFQLVRGSTRKPHRLTQRLRLEGLIRRTADHGLHHPRQLAGLVAVSALVGLPPLAVVSPIAGAARMRRRMFFLYGFVGRLGRFSILAFAPAML